MVEQDWIEMVMEDVRDYLSGTILENAPLIPFSSLTGEGREKLMAALESAADGIPPRSDTGIFRLPVDRVFTMKGFGTVVTGTLISGAVSAGEEVVFLPPGNRARLRGIQVHGELVSSSSSGTRTALNLQGLDKSEIQRGQTAARPGSLEPSLMLDAVINLLPAAPRSLKNRDRVRMHLFTDEVMTRVTVLDGEVLDPGSDGLVQLRLEKMAVALPGDRFVIRSYSPITTIGGGKIIDPLPRKHRRNRPQVMEHLKKLESDDPSLRIRALLDEAGDHGMPARELSIRSGLASPAMKILLSELAGKGEVVVSETGEGLEAYSSVFFEKIKERLIRALEKFHDTNPTRTGIGREELRMRVARQLPDRPYRSLLHTLEEKGGIVLEGDTVRLDSHEASLTPQQEILAGKVVNILRPKGLSAPFLPELAEELKVPAGDLKTVLNLLVDKGDLVRIKDEYFVTPGAHRSLLEGIEAHFEVNGELALADFRDIVNTTRKWMIPLLEYLDRTQVTMRKGDVRIRRGQAPSGG
jgi:selenocysteine-specific elongation factor